MSDSLFKTTNTYLDLGYMPNIGQDGSGSVDDWGSEEIVPAAKLIPDSHQYLFDYLDADLESADRLLDEAIAEEDREKRDKAAESIRRSHPFFGYYEINVEKYVKKTVMEKLRHPGSNVNSAEMFGITSDDMHELSEERSLELKGSVMSLLKMQERLRTQTVLLLSDNNEALAGVPMIVRAGLFGLYDQRRLSAPPFDPVLSDVRAQDVIPLSASMKLEQAKLDFDEAYEERFRSGIEELLHDEAGLPPVIKEITENADTEDGGALGLRFEAEYLEDILELEMKMLLFSGSRVKKCGRCGRYFVVEEDGNRFCQRLDAKTGWTCRGIEYAREIKPEADRIYHRAYKTHHDRITAGKETKEEVDAWREKARKLQDKVLYAEITPKEYRVLLMRPANEL